MKVYLRTFGCRANQYDTEAVRAMVEAAGGEIVASPDEADVAVFNSCAVTAAAEADLRQSVRRAARQRPALRTVVMGCAAALDDAGDARGAADGRASRRPARTSTAIAAALGLAPRRVPRRLTRRPARGRCSASRTGATSTARSARRRWPAAPTARARRDSLVDEAHALAERHPEIVHHRDPHRALRRRHRRLARRARRAAGARGAARALPLRRSRRPRSTTGCASCSRSRRRLAPHLHAPLQSGSDRVLKRMGRHWYTAATLRARRRADRCAARSVFALGADVIAGFPGETDDDHAATVALVEALPFTYLHVFPYSARPGTAAERLPGPAFRAHDRSRRVRASFARSASGGRAALPRRARGRRVRRRGRGTRRRPARRAHRGLS